MEAENSVQMRDGGGRKGRECKDSKKRSSHILKVKLRDSSVGFNAKDEKTKQQTNKTRNKSGVWPKKKKLESVSTSTMVGKGLGAGEWAGAWSVMTLTYI